MHRISRIVTSLSVGLMIASHALPAAAIDHCRTKVSRADGTIFVKARGIAGTPLWGDSLGQEINPFFNAASCVASGAARACTFGAPGTLAGTTPPEGCVAFLKDDGPTTCETAVKGCFPTPPLLPCTLFPADNIWNRDVSMLPVHAQSSTFVAAIGAGAPLHPDFGAGLPFNGIPYTVVTAGQPPVPISFLYFDESDPGPYPIPPFAPVEGGSALAKGRGDSHVLIVDSSSCRLYEIYAARRHDNGASWSAGSGAVWDLGSNALRPVTWTSADAAGLPILPGLVRYDEILAGVIQHAIRFTAANIRDTYIWPARHSDGVSSDSSSPPMGTRFRLKAGVDISGFSTTNQIILTAMKKYGMMLADSGSAWFISGVPDERWDDEDLHHLSTLTGADFEAVDESSLMVDPDSGQAF